MKYSASIICLALFSLLISTSANSVTFNVTTTQELRDALSTASSNGEDDIINLANGTYKTTDDNKGTFIYISDELNTLKIIGSSSDNVILDGDNTHKIFFNSYTDTINGGVVTIENISFINSNSPDSGGALYSNQNNLIIRNSLFYNNATNSSFGGAIFISSGEVEIYNSIFELNHSTHGGGGLAVYYGKGLILDSTFKNNTTGDVYSSNNGGGAIQGRQGSIFTISNSTFTGNSSRGGGGAIMGTVYADKLTILNNTSAGSGGGIFGDGSIQNSIIEGNRCTGACYGGGIHFQSGNIFNNIIKNNSSEVVANHEDRDSGGLYAGGNTFIVNNLVIDNSSGASSYGGTFINNIFINNENFDINAYSNSIATIKNNYINPTKIQGVSINSGNIFDSVVLGFVDKNNSNFRLLSNSSLINAGLKEYQELEFPEKDADNMPRLSGQSIDIGPYEFQEDTFTVDCSSTNITLTTQAEVDNFQATYGGGGVCDAVTGRLTVSGSDITDIDALSNLTSVDGFVVDHSNNLTNLDGFIGLTTARQLSIGYVDALTNLNGLLNVTSLGSVQFVSANKLGNLDGLSNVASTVMSVHILNNAALTNFDSLKNLTGTGVRVRITGNDALISLDGLSGITSTDDLIIAGNDVLNNLNVLAVINSVAGDFSIGINLGYPAAEVGNKILGNCSGAAGLLGWPTGTPNDRVGGDVYIQGNAYGCNSIEEILASVSGPTVPVITTSQAAYGQATLTFSSSATTDTLWPITGYQAKCIADEQSIFENNIAMDIPDLDSVASSIAVAGILSANSAALSIPVNITHPRTRHLTLILTSPSGTSVMLWDEAVGSGTDLIGTFPTTLEPAESLDAFDGEDFNGEWQLTVADGVASQTGTLNSWGITVRDKVTATSDTSPISLTGLADSQPYSCTVSAITGLGIGPESNTISVTPIAPENPLQQMNAGLNDAWFYEPTTGQGFFINVFPDIEYVSLSWFTYDTERPPEEVTANLGDPGHRWLMALGPYSGNQAVMDVSITSGGIFDTPTEVTEVNDGTIILTFSDCENGLVEYNIPSINRHGFVPIKRVVGDNIALCEAFEEQTATQQSSTKRETDDVNTQSWDVPVTVAEVPLLVDMNAGLNDAWFNLATNGQGFFINVFPDIEYVSLSWFTYDTERPPEEVTANMGDPGHRWLMALGSYSGNQAVMDVSITTGGIFDTPTEVTEVNDGTIILTFSDCDNGTVEYNIPSINQQETVPIKRIVADNIALCEALIPE